MAIGPGAQSLQSHKLTSVQIQGWGEGHLDRSSGEGAPHPPHALRAFGTFSPLRGEKEEAHTIVGTGLNVVR